MKTTQHTPLPWDTVSGPEIVTVGVSGKGALAIMSEENRAGGLILNRSIANANAQFIVTACNTHDELLKALKVAADKLYDLREWSVAYSDPKQALSVQVVEEEIRNIIAKAQGKE